MRPSSWAPTRRGPRNSRPPPLLPRILDESGMEWDSLPLPGAAGGTLTGGGYRVGVLGATGLVGTTILEVLVERGFPVAELVPFASERSVGRRIPWSGDVL